MRSCSRQIPTLLFAFALLITVVIGCRMSDGIHLGPERVVVSWGGWLKDGEATSWRLPAGTYRLELTANNDGVTAEWVGGNCPKTQAMLSLTMTCAIPHDGQLIVTNPTILGLGKPVSTSVKVTKL